MVQDAGPRRSISVAGKCILLYHAALFALLPLYLARHPPGAALLVASAALLFLTEIGIGGAYHRFYAHRCYALSRPAEGLLLFLATLAFQGAALRWAFEHRLHHAHVDTDDDPYSIHKGFWYAHMLWIFEPGQAVDLRRARDLNANPLVRFQERHYLALSLGGNLIVCGLIGWLAGDLIGGLVIAWWARLLVSHHLTWLINSAAHYWGERSYSKEHSARDNYLLALLTVGEGYHNYHHTFASDYRNGVRWYHFDPTKWTVWSLSKLGLASQLKRVDAFAIRKRLLIEDRRLLLSRLERQARAKQQEFEHLVHHLSEVIHGKIVRMSHLVEEIRALKQRRVGRHKLRAHRIELKSLRQSLQRDWTNWYHLCGQILRLEPQPA